MGLNTILLSDLNVVVERRAYPCTKIGILLKSCRYCMLVPVPVSVVPVPVSVVPVPVYWVPVPLPHCMWVPVPVSVVPVPLPLQIAPLHYNTTQGPSTAAVINSDDLHLFSGIKPLQNLCTGLEKPAHA